MVSFLQAIPRKIWLEKSGKQLVQWPVQEIEKLRANHVSLASKSIKGGSVIEVSGVTAVQVIFWLLNFYFLNSLDNGFLPRGPYCKES